MDRLFWSRLEYAACRWLAASADPHLVRLWIDGFVPESIADTRCGVEVKGVAWIGRERMQRQVQFVAAVPQKLLRGGRENFAIVRLHFDEVQGVLEVSVIKATAGASSGTVSGD